MYLYVCINVYVLDEDISTSFLEKQYILCDIEGESIFFLFVLKQQNHD